MKYIAIIVTLASIMFVSCQPSNNSKKEYQSNDLNKRGHIHDSIEELISVKNDNNVDSIQPSINIEYDLDSLPFDSGSEILKYISFRIKFKPDSIIPEYRRIKGMTIPFWSRTNFYIAENDNYKGMSKRNFDLYKVLTHNVKSDKQFLIKERKFIFSVINRDNAFKVRDSVPLNIDLLLLSIYKDGVKYSLSPFVSHAEEVQ
ncbi:hypothetical protein BZG02_16790 [Labilibaculum filiforme]|uniref:Lipoprotein n=1 Tax=Labilibaculum filiforme TaxID=1940526 RepID=A0A2N3HSS6_9BACT|nr:hypothetical protein [Labilibaculum filiforme]PKQ61102.1 hypothetical protein BZG02_16790 [Labilibaculum filiforme]